MERLMLTAAGIAIAGAGLVAVACEEVKAQAYPQKVWTLPSPVVSLGYCSLTVGSSTVSTLSSCGSGIPAAPAGTLGPVYALIEAAGPLFFRDDGTAATTAAGFPLASNTPTAFAQNPLSSISFIGSTTSTQLNVIFYAVR